MRHHRLPRRIQRRLRRRRVRLTHAMNADAIRRRRLIRFELRRKLARDHAAALVDLHDPCAAQEIEIAVDGALDDIGTEAESPRIRVECEWFAGDTEILAE